MMTALVLSMSLAGNWQLELDPDDQGVTQRWYARDLNDRIALPGCLAEHHKGTYVDTVDTIKYTRTYQYFGAAWYQRDVDIPADWAGKRITMSLERVMWVSQVWVDGRPAGSRDRLSTPHVYDLSGLMTPGQHRLSIRIDNRLAVPISNGMGPMAYADDAPAIWNGITGSMELSATQPVWVDQLDVYPDLAGQRARVKAVIGNMTGQPATGQLNLQALLGEAVAGKASCQVQADGERTTVQTTVDLSANLKLWDEFEPNLYRMQADVVVGGGHDAKTVVFGMRELGRRGHQFTLNGNVIFLRGTVDCAAFPLTGYPDTTVEGWRRILSTLKAHGLNHMRFHSWTPPEAAFQAADELGMLLQAENPMWRDEPNVLEKDERRLEWLRDEQQAILAAYGNHPSFGFHAQGNELGAVRDPKQIELMLLAKQTDPRHMYTRTSGYLDLPDQQQDYAVISGTATGWMRCQGRFPTTPPNTRDDWSQAEAAMDRPAVTHEMSSWSMFPDLRERDKWTGFCKPLYLDWYQRQLERSDLMDRALDFHRASAAFTVQLDKEELEIQLRTRDHAGYAMLSINDFPGQCCAFDGVLDTFYDSKGVISAEGFARFAGPAVLLARMDKRVWTDTEAFNADLEIANYRREDLSGAVTWSVTDTAGKVLADGTLAEGTYAAGGLRTIGPMSVPAGKLAASAKYTLTVRLDSAGLINTWDFWVFPADASQPDAGQVLVTRDWPEAQTALAAGRRVLLMPRLDEVFYSLDGAFPTCFWSLGLFGSQVGTMGLLIQNDHAAMKGFPCDFHSDWQWYDLARSSQALILRNTPRELRPIVEVIDNHDRGLKLSLVFEARVGPGRLLVSTIDLPGLLAERPEARQFYRSLLAYANSDAFDPTVELDAVLASHILTAKPAIQTDQAPPTTDDAVLSAVPDRAWMGWIPDIDTVLVKQEGFGYRVEGQNYKFSRTGQAAWERWWLEKPLTFHVTCPVGFEGTLYLCLIDAIDMNEAPVVKLGKTEVARRAFGTSQGYWLAVPVTAKNTPEGFFRINVEAPYECAYVTKMVLRPTAAAPATTQPATDAAADTPATPAAPYIPGGPK